MSIIPLLNEITKKYQKTFNRKITSSLVKLERELFSEELKLTTEEMRILIFGNDEYIGLLNLCDSRNQIQNNLKGSAVKSFGVIYALMTEHSFYFFIYNTIINYLRKKQIIS